MLTLLAQSFMIATRADAWEYGTGARPESQPRRRRRAFWRGWL